MSSNIRVNSITPSVGNSVAIGTAGGSVSFNNAAVVDIDGHTELDNVNISGVVTATSFVGPVTGDITGNIIGDVTGNITGVAATFSGNVSIAGTLTYEDVTNIDSVGLVTARDGIIVTGGNVGIGTDNATQLLQINKSENYGNVTTGGASILLSSKKGSYNDGSYTENIVFTRPNNPSVGNAFIGIRNIGTSGNSGALVFGVDTVSFVSEQVCILPDGKIGISSTAPKTDVDISQKTGAVALPQGTTAQRPTGSAPYIRKNTTNNALEYYDGTSWVEIITDYFPTGSVILG